MYARSDQNLHWAAYTLIAKGAKCDHVDNEDSDQTVQMRAFSKVSFSDYGSFHFLLSSKKSGPLVQSLVTLTNSLVTKMVIVLISTITNSHVVLLKKKMWVAFANATQIFSKNISIAIFNDQF